MGIDGFRIDTVSHAPLKFWSEFLHGEGGIYPYARSLGKDFFLTFGEALYLSEPYDDRGERQASAYLGGPQMPGLNSVLGFPMSQSLTRLRPRASPGGAGIPHRQAAGVVSQPAHHS